MSKLNAKKIAESYETDEDVDSTNDSIDLGEKMYGYGRYYGYNWRNGIYSDYDPTKTGAERFLTGADGSGSKSSGSGK